MQTEMWLFQLAQKILCQTLCCRCSIFSALLYLLRCIHGCVYGFCVFGGCRLNGVRKWNSILRRSSLREHVCTDWMRSSLTVAVKSSGQCHGNNKHRLHFKNPVSFHHCWQDIMVILELGNQECAFFNHCSHSHSDRTEKKSLYKY